MGFRVDLDIVSKRKIPTPCRELNPNHPIIQPTVGRYTNWAVPALINYATVQQCTIWDHTEMSYLNIL
jgi:hypothetical protein